MKFAPKTKKEHENANLWDKGNYSFEIIEAEDAVDKNQKPMMKMKVKVFKDNGNSQNIFDYLSNEWMGHKLYHLCEAVGLLAQYESGEIHAYDFVGKTGIAKVGVSIDKSGEYPDKNSISDYVVGAPKAVPAAVEEDDSIPF